MRTTLDIEDSVLSAAKELARRQGKTTGEVISALARQAMLHGVGASDQRTDPAVSEPPASYGFRPLAATNDTVVTNALVDKLRDELGV